MIITTPNEVDEFSPYLAEIENDMRRMGPPKIRACWDPMFKGWDAIEGSHRVHVANKIGFPVIICPVDEFDCVEHDVMELLPGKSLVNVILHTLKGMERGIVEFDDDMVLVESPDENLENTQGVRHP